MRVGVAALTTFLLLAPAALAQQTGGEHGNLGHDGGEGLWGETTDKIVTNFGFILIAFFPLLVFALSMLQGRLDKRKDARKKAEKARKSRADLRGGW
jgi:preprotein translocase subunit SecG